jgi:folate-binding protein YgfZ
MSETLPPLFYRDVSDRGRLLLTGRDRQTFLQGMVTNNITALAPGQGCYAFLLDSTGHVLADARVLCLENALLLDVEPGTAGFVAETLEKYLIMERVKTTDVTADTAAYFIGGAEAWDFFEVLAVPGIAEWGEGMNGPFAHGNSEAFPARVAVTRLIPGQGYTAYLAREDAPDFKDYLVRTPAEEISAELLEALRIEAGVPRFGADMDARTLAPETGQGARAIHYRKGCYIGQEIVARIDARGHVNRGLAGFLLAPDAPLPAPDTPVTVDGKEVGRITSAALSPTLARPIALGYVRREHAEPGTAVQIAGVGATVSALPFQIAP